MCKLVRYKTLKEELIEMKEGYEKMNSEFCVGVISGLEGMIKELEKREAMKVKKGEIKL